MHKRGLSEPRRMLVAGHSDGSDIRQHLYAKLQILLGAERKACSA